MPLHALNDALIIDTRRALRIELHNGTGFSAIKWVHAASKPQWRSCRRRIAPKLDKCVQRTRYAAVVG